MSASQRAVVTEAIETHGVVAVIRLQDARRLRPVVDALAEGGVRLVEVTMTVPGGVEAIRDLARSEPPGIVVGAGTVTDADTARLAILAGARFVVSPVFRADLVGVCHERDVPVIPGCLTPTEILSAWEAGADIVKVFPAGALGPSYLAELRGPFPQVKLMPTGGVTPDNAGDWIRAGAVAVGAGGALVNAHAAADGRYDVITANARRIVAMVRAARAQA
jgi:2-dehydro-3-deoxyphosphogluconate aldolase/(4S)-4-hydroxy-2-oxoglutarate aldolase